MARVIQRRLQGIAERERELPDSQCGFCKGRGCSDTTFNQTQPSNVVRQLAEKAIEHRVQQFLIYVNLKKAYDS